MKIATLVLTHANPELTFDTVNSISTYVSDRTLIVVDSIGWKEFKNFKNCIKGYYHGHPRSPYRNYVFGMQKLYEKFPDSDWFLYAEYDCLFSSNAFKEDLSRAESLGAWSVGVDLRKFDCDFQLLAEILRKGTIKNSYYFLGCCQFHHNKFIKKLHELNFFDRFLDATKDFEKGYFPDYDRWAFEEELWPTLAMKLGGSLYELVCWKSDNGEWQKTKDHPNIFYSGADHEMWRGKFKRYPVRNNPPITDIDVMPETSIMHPLKEFDPIRISQRSKRKNNLLIF